MLQGIDKGLELLGWIAALALVIMLFVGPQVVAEDEPAKEGAAGAAPYAGQASGGAAAPVDGKALFSDRCGSCHTLSTAGTSGGVGPNLDDSSLDAAAIETIVRDGTGSMPAFGGELSDGEITAVADFVAGD